MTHLATKHPGVYVIHADDCASHRGKRCRCGPMYYARVSDGQGGRINSERSPHQEKILDWQNRTKQAVQDGRRAITKRLTLAEAWTQFEQAMLDGTALTNKGEPYRPTTIHDYQSCYQLRILDALGSEYLDAITRGKAQTFFDGLIKEGLSTSRIKSNRAAIAAVFRWAMLRDHVDGIPLRDVQMPRSDEKAPEYIPSLTEMRALIDAVDARDQLPIALAAYATGRRAEIRALQWQHVNVEDGYLRWLPTYTLEHQDHGKTLAADRVVPITSKLRPYLQAEIARQPNRQPEDYVCPTRRKTSVPVLNIDSLMKRARKAWSAKGLRPIQLHHARHAAGSYFIAAGVNLKTVSTMMGHSSINITVDRYGHLLPGAEHEAAELFDAYAQQQDPDSDKSVTDMSKKEAQHGTA